MRVSLFLIQKDTSKSPQNCGHFTGSKPPRLLTPKRRRPTSQTKLLLNVTCPESTTRRFLKGRMNSTQAFQCNSGLLDLCLPPKHPNTKHQVHHSLLMPRWKIPGR